MIGKAVCYSNILLVYVMSLLVACCYSNSDSSVMSSKIQSGYNFSPASKSMIKLWSCDKRCVIRLKNEKASQLFLFVSTFHQVVKLYESLKAPIVELRAYIAFFCCKKSLFSFRIHFNQIRYQIFPLTCYRRVLSKCR